MRFDSYHPAINLIFFASVITATVRFLHPVFVALSLVCSFVYSVKLCGRRAFFGNLALLLLAAAWMFTRFINKIQDDKCYVPRDFCDALFNPGKLFAIARWAIGLLMCLGSVVLLVTSETDVDADFIRIICLLGFLSGLAFPFVLSSL